MDTVTLAITLPTHGTAWDYVAALNIAIGSNPDMLAQMALSGLLQHIQVAVPTVPGTGEMTLVYGKM